MSDLGEYNGRPIVGTGIIIRNTGDGLSKAMTVDPRDLTIGDQVYVLLEATCVDMHYPVEDPKYPAIGGVRRIPVLSAGTATFIDEADASAAIQRQKEREREHADKVSGQVTISMAILAAEHDDGKHAKKRVPGCEPCDEEARLEAAEADAAREAAAIADAEAAAEHADDEVAAARGRRGGKRG